MSILEIKDLSHVYDSKTLFSKASLSVSGGEHSGIVGLNGAGKSTFIKILSGEVLQDEGEVKWLNGLTRGYLDQHADIDRSLTVMEYLRTSFADLYALNEKMEGFYAQMGDADEGELDKLITKANNILDTLTSRGFFEIDATIKKVAGGLGVSAFGYDTPIGTLSGGGRAKLMLTKLLLTKPDIMLLDEPTNFLDIEHIEWLVEFLNGTKSAFLVISHDIDFLDKVCKNIINIENGEIKKYSGNYSQFVVQREQNAKQYEEAYARQQREIEKMTDYIERNKARAATAGMANSRKKMLDKIEVIRKPTVIYDAEFYFPYVELHTKELLATDKLEVGYDFALLPPISLEMGSETRLWLRGTNGIGKTTIIKTILGKIARISGGTKFHPAAKIAYIEQDLEFDNSELLPAQYLSDKFPRLNQKEIRALLAKVGLKNELALKPISTLSGGEQVRLKLAALMNIPSNLLILDEPTNHLDVRAKDSLKKALLAYKGAILLVSHEKDWAAEICNKILDVKG
ncbi:MAG: ABC-F family ATP-binding cassette domain-containing protein [Clostridia bacterium]|nr:ABC-F family ATP-binding cassette domain-containing protein [Clostridia bacterium]